MPTHPQSPATPRAAAHCPAPLPPAAALAEPPVRKPARALLGPPPLIAGEDATDYDDMRLRILADVMPEDFVEEIFARNVVDLVWESIRLRRLKAQLMQSARHKGLRELLRSLFDWTTADRLAKAWALGDEEAIAQVEDTLACADLTIDAIMAQTLAANIDEFERIDRMITVTEVRRDVVLREIEQRRIVFGRALRRAGDTALEAIEDVPLARAPLGDT